MARKLFILVLYLFAVQSVLGQILITDQTTKLKGKKEHSFYFGAAAGDKIRVEVLSVDGKSIGELTLAEYPSVVKFSDYSFVDCAKELSVTEETVFELKIHNTSLAKRICGFKVYRTPSSPETIDFNPNVIWVEKRDTIWHQKTRKVVVGYDEKLVKRTKRELVKVDTSFVELLSTDLTVSPASTEYQTVNFPANVLTPNKYQPSYSKEVIAWSFWIGVGQESVAEFETKQKLAKDALVAGGTLAGYPILGSLAAGGVSHIANRNGEKEIRYSVDYFQNGQWYNSAYGNVVSVTRRMQNPTQGSFRVSFKNESTVLFGSERKVWFKCVAMIINKFWGNVSYDEKVSVPLYRYENYQEPEVLKTMIPMLGM